MTAAYAALRGSYEVLRKEHARVCRHLEIDPDESFVEDLGHMTERIGSVLRMIREKESYTTVEGVFEDLERAIDGR